MRFGAENGALSFSFLPQSVPVDLYASKRVVVRKTVATKSAEPDKKQLQLIRAIGKLLKPDLLLDNYVFPLKPDVARAIFNLREEGDSLIRDYFGDYICVTVAGRVELLSSRGNRIVATGDVGDVFSYASKYCKSAIPCIVSAMRAGFVPRLPECDDLAVMLSWFRKQRMFSKGLDVISKTDELSYVDQENVTNKFVIDYGEVVSANRLCLHLGAGTNTSSSQLALAEHYDRVVMVDPRCKEGPDSKAAVFNKSKVEEGWDIVSDVAVGDSEGMTLDGQKRLVEDLYSICDKRLVIVKIGLMKGIVARGFVRRKPRPHNLEVIIQLDRDGDTLDEIYEELYPTVIDANERRNRAVFQHQFGGLKKNFNDRWFYGRLLTTTLRSRLPPADNSFRTKVDRNMVLFEQAGGKTAGVRYVQYCKAAGRVYDPDAPAALLPDDYVIDPGLVKRNDPGLPCPHYSFRSVVRTGIDRGMKLVYRFGNATLANA